MNLKLRHPVAEYPDNKIRVLDAHNILYVYLDELQTFRIETNHKILKFILEAERNEACRNSSFTMIPEDFIRELADLLD